MLDTDKRSAGWERIVPPDASMERVLTGFANFADGPAWDATEGCLLFTDSWTNVSPGKIWKWVPGRQPEVVLSPCKALGATLDTEGRLVVAGWGSRTIWRREHDGATVVLASHYKGLKINTPNDVVAHSNGGIYWTDHSAALFGNGRAVDPGDDVQQYLDFNAVMRVWPGSAHVEAVASDFASPNGIAFSPDERLLYVNDTARRHIRVFDVQADGTLAGGGVFYEAEDDLPGTFDGMRVDVEGNIYCTAQGGIHVISPSGDLIVRIKHPVPVGNVAWGGPDWRWLFLIVRESIYRIELKIPGMPVGRR